MTDLLLVGSPVAIFREKRERERERAESEDDDLVASGPPGRLRLLLELHRRSSHAGHLRRRPHRHRHRSVLISFPPSSSPSSSNPIPKPLSLTFTSIIQPNLIPSRGVQRHRRRDGADTGAARGPRRHGRQEPPRRPGRQGRRPRPGAGGQARRHGARPLVHGLRPRLRVPIHRQGSPPQHPHVCIIIVACSAANRHP